MQSLVTEGMLPPPDLLSAEKAAPPSPSGRLSPRSLKGALSVFAYIHPSFHDYFEYNHEFHDYSF